MDTHEEHPSKASAWRDGAFVVHPDAAAEDCTVWVHLGDDGPRELEWEGLLGRRLGEDRVVLCSIPHWAYNLNLGDEVSVVASAEGPLVATDRVTDAGNSTFRAILPREGSWQQLMADLEPFTCWFDIRTPTYLAISVPSTHAGALAAELQRREDAGELKYETASR